MTLAAKSPGSPSSPCSMATLVEARWDGRLDEREHRSLERHIATCAVCTEIQRGLDEVREQLRQPVGRPATPLEHQRARLALLQAVSLGGTRVRHVGPATPVNAWSLLVARARSLPALAVAVAAVSLFGLAGLALAGPLSRISSPASVQQVPRAVSMSAIVRPVPQTPPVVLDGKPPSPPARPVPQIPPSALALGEPVPAPLLRADGEAARGGGSKGGAAKPSSAKPSSAEPSSAEQASSEFDEAVKVLGSGDYAAARARLEAFRSVHPSDDRADLASFLAIVSLHRAGRREEARAAARRYLDLYPNGDRRAEAERFVKAPARSGAL